MAQERLTATAATEIAAWHLESTELSDGSVVWDVIGVSDEARVTINCDSELAAIEVQATLIGRAAGASAERL